MRAMRLAMLGLLAATLSASQAGCADPCADDPLHCGMGGDFQFAPSCDLTGPLDVALGQGTNDFALLTDNEEPIVHTGSQGGHHLCLGVRLTNPALEYPELQLTFDAEIYDPSQCAPGDQTCDGWVGSAHRQLVLGPDLPLDDQGAVEQDGLLLILSIWPTNLERRVRLDVVDPCHREGMIDHDIPAQTAD